MVGRRRMGLLLVLQKSSIDKKHECAGCENACEMRTVMIRRIAVGLLHSVGVTAPLVALSLHDFSLSARPPSISSQCLTLLIIPGNLLESPSFPVNLSPFRVTSLFRSISTPALLSVFCLAFGCQFGQLACQSHCQ